MTTAEAVVAVPARRMVPAVLIAIAETATPMDWQVVLVGAKSASVRYHSPAVRGMASAPVDR